MKSDSAPIGDELDLLKVYIWVMLVLTIAFGGVLWFTNSKVEATDKLVANGTKKLDEFADSKEEILAMLNVYSTNREDEARERPNTWFSKIWQRKGIPDASVRPQSWQSKFYSRGNFDEEFITIKFDNKNPLTREQIGQFCHEIERSSTRLRCTELKLRRDTKKKAEVTKEDRWSGEVTVGYRLPRIRE